MGERERPELAELWIADPPERWEALGFLVHGGACEVGGVTLRLRASGKGITAWSIRNVCAVGEIDGLSTAAAGPALEPSSVEHPNGAAGIDHVVVVTPDFERTAQALDRAGLTLRRTRDAGGFRQGFRRLGPAILELVEANSAPAGPAVFWGLVVIVDDLEALAERLGDRLGKARPAVQPGRQIATLSDAAGLSLKVALMTPEAG